MSKLVSIEVTPEEDAAANAAMDALIAVRERFKQANDGIALFINVNVAKKNQFNMRTGITGWWASSDLVSCIDCVIAEKNGSWMHVEADRLRRHADELDAEAAALEGGE